MTTFNVTIELVTPNIRSDQAHDPNWMHLTGAQKGNIQTYWKSVVPVPPGPFNFTVTADSPVEALTAIDRQVSTRLSSAGHRIVAIPVSAAYPDVTAYNWTPCGPGCHYGPRVLAEYEPDKLTLLTVESDLYIQPGARPWAGVVIVKYTWRP